MSDVNEQGMLSYCRACESKNRIPFNKLHRKGNCARCGMPLRHVSQVMHLVWEDIFWRCVRTASVPVLIAFVHDVSSEKELEAELEVAASCAFGDYVVGIVELERNPGLANDFKLKELPTMILFKQGVDMGRLVQRLGGKGFEMYVRGLIDYQ